MNIIKVLYRIKITGIILSFLLILPGCEKLYNPSVDSVEPMLVVEGSVSTVPGIQKIKLSYSNSYNANSKYLGFTGADVFVSDEKGNIIPFNEIGQGGLYVSDTNEFKKAEIGKTYTLHIKSKEGDVFESEPQTIVKCAPMDSVFCENDEQKVLEKNLNGDYFEIVYDGIRVEVNTKGLFPNQNFYLYSWEAYGEYSMGIKTATSIEAGYEHVILPSKYNNIICTGNADNFSNQFLLNNRLLFIPNDDLQNQMPTSLLSAHPAAQSADFQGLIFRLEQKSISENAYLFWNSVQKQLDATGKLFDPVASQISGNIKCTSNNLKKAFGAFYAYDVSERYAYLYMSKRNRTTSIPLAELPIIITDTLFMNLPPKGWVYPPF